MTEPGVVAPGETVVAMVNLELEAVLARHRAFWERTPAGRPLLRVAPWEEWRPYAPFVLRDGTTPTETYEIVPGLLDPVATLQSTRPQQLLDGDFLCCWGPYDQCWTEAILGCRILRAGPSVWAEPFVADWSQLDTLPPPKADWIEELLAVNRVLIAETDGRYPVAQPLMRGPLDMVEAAIPTELLYIGFYEEPERLRALLDHCTAVFLTVAHQRVSGTPRFQGGYAVRSEWGLWAPGRTVQFQADASRNLSPKIYRDFLIEIDQRIASEFEYPIFHTHSGSHHILRELVKVPGLRAIEVTIDPDPYGPPPLELLPAFEMIQAAEKSLLISGPMRQAELDILLERLSPVGLGIRAGIISG